MSAFPKHILAQIAGIALLTLGVLLAFALVTYSPWDQALSAAGPQRPSANLIGPSGAWAADLLFQLIGFSALLLPVPLVIVGFKQIRSRPVEFPFIKAVGVVAALLFTASLLQLLDPGWPGDRNFVPGGIAGLLLGDELQAYLNRTGAVIVAVAGLISAVTLTTRFSLDGILNWLGRRQWRWAHAIPERIQGWKADRSDQRKLEEIAASTQKMVVQPLPERMSFEEHEKHLQPPLVESTEPKPQPKLRHPVIHEPIRNESMVPPWTEDPAPTGGGVDKPFRLPPLDFLQIHETVPTVSREEMLKRAETLSTKCAEFGVGGQVVNILPGPVVTTFEFKPDPGVKYSRITNLSDDLCLALRAESVRIDRVPGKNTVGIEVPNLKRRTIMLREVLSSPEFQQASSRLTLALGQRINGEVFVADLAKAPHLLIAGATGAGKSVCLNCMVCSILYKAAPRDVRIIMVDPKRLELGLYENIPHLLTPIVTDPKKAANALQWAVREMEERYKTLARHGVRNIDQYNQFLQDDPALADSEEVHLPYIVIIVDELADLMMTAGKDVETAVTRLAQMARAVGIHLILATQRPSVDVITGLIKANFPTRLSFRVSSKIDSRTILDMNGAEQLLGMGDSLFLSPQTSRLVRVHGAFINEKEIARLVGFLKEQAQPEYREEILIGDEEGSDVGLIEVSDLQDKLYDEAARFVVEIRKASTSLLQRRFRIGYGRAARLLDIMEHEGIVGPSEGSRPREVLVPPDYFDEVSRRD